MTDNLEHEVSDCCVDHSAAAALNIRQVLPALLLVIKALEDPELKAQPQSAAMQE